MKKNNSKYFLIFSITLIYVLSTGTLSAINPDNLAEAEIQERTNYIENSLKTGETGSRVWYWTFLGLYSAGTIAQLSLYFATDQIMSDPVEAEHFRQDMMVGTITTALGVLNLAIFPMTSMYARNSFVPMPESTRDQKILKLKGAEASLATSSRWERDNNSLVIHALNFGVNLAAGLVIWLAFNRTILDGLITFLPGFAVGEIQILTQPTAAIRDWQKYEEKYNSKLSYYRNKENKDMNWHLAAAPGGLMIVREF